MDATPPPAKQQMMEQHRQTAESIIEDRLQTKEAFLAQAEEIVTILNNAWHAGDLDLREDEFWPEIETLERLIIALRGDVVVIRTSRHELGGRLMDDMMWQQDRQNTDRAYVELLIDRYKTPEGAKLSLFASRDPSAQERFRNKVLKAYDAGGKMSHWCVISGKYYDESNVRAAHIVSYNVGEPSARHLLGPPSNKDGHLMAAKNGIPMHYRYEQAFDDGRLVIVPDGDPKNGCWKVCCLDIIGEDDPNSTIPLGRELQGRSLQFRNDFRPASRYLYFAFCMSILRRQRHEVPGWWRDYLVDGPGKGWATPGSYLRTLTLCTIAHQIGHLTKEEAAVFAVENSAQDEDENDYLHSRLIGCAYASQTSTTSSWNDAPAQINGTENSEEEEEEEDDEEEDDEEKKKKKKKKRNKSRKKKKKKKKNDGLERLDAW